MIKLYIDFDGVILNTIDVTYQLLGEIDLKDHDKVLEFYQNLDWEDLIKKSTPIENSINNLKKLLKSNLYDISILSHVASAEEAKVNAIKHLTCPVLWTSEEKEIAELCRNSSDEYKFLEVGPGKVLNGLWRDSGNAEMIPAFQFEDIISDMENKEAL